MSGFYTALVEFYTEEVLRGFLPRGFPKENICVLVFLCFCACCSFSDLLVTNCFKISSKEFKKIQHGIRATLKGSTAQLGFVVPNKSLNKSTKKEGSPKSALNGASFYGDKTEFQEFSILDKLLLPGQTRVLVFLEFHHQSQEKEDTVYLTSGGRIISTIHLYL